MTFTPKQRAKIYSNPQSKIDILSPIRFTIYFVDMTNLRVHVFYCSIYSCILSFFSLLIQLEVALLRCVKRVFCDVFFVEGHFRLSHLDRTVGGHDQVGLFLKKKRFFSGPWWANVVCIDYCVLYQIIENYETSSMIRARVST